MQALHPILSKALAIPLWQEADMDEETPFDFDLELVQTEMKRQGFKQTDLARVAQITSQSAISNIFKGKRQVKVREAAKIYAFLGLKAKPLEPAIQWIPEIGFAGAGAWREAIRDPRDRYPIQKGSVGPNAFAVRIAGDSMDKIIPNGGVIIVDPDQRHLYDKKVYLLRNESGEVTVKMYRSDPARFEPMSNNVAHQTLPIGEEQFTIVGRAVHTVGDL